ncbi:MAG: FAD-binding oxidoreductase [Candidatus Omnitrophica bacterium]|nr:FAD-binding oxidoreductase [Candidatus Omnitrophota bacterium]
MSCSKIFLLFLYFSLSQGNVFAQDTIFNDVSRLNPVNVHKVVNVASIGDIRSALQEARSQGLKISIAGKRHSQGGQQACVNCIVLDMLGFNKVLSFDVTNKVIRVQPGATWEQIQAYAKPHGCAVKVMQASNIFTVGGSLGVNTHGNDPNYGSIIETVRSFHFMRADGSLINVSREEDLELFILVIGGYGLFGVIVDVDLELTSDAIYKMTSKVMDYKEYPEYFKTHVFGNRAIGLHSAKLSNAPDSLLREVVVTDYAVTKETDESLFALQGEKNVLRNKFFLGLSRTFDWGKNLRWFFEKRLVAKVGAVEYVSRNNAMRPIVKFLDYSWPNDTDILQEYFIPTDKFTEFVDGLRKIMREDHVNLLSVTVRYVPTDKQSFLHYAKGDCFAVVLYINQRLDEKHRQEAQAWTRKMVDLALSHGGTYYLPYQLYPSKDQVRRSYPEFDQFIEKKRVHDPQELFVNQFYERYR